MISALYILTRLRGRTYIPQRQKGMLSSAQQGKKKKTLHKSFGFVPGVMQIFSAFEHMDFPVSLCSSVT
jgi:hypothetical protein